MTVLAAGAPPSHAVLLTAAVLGIAVVVVLITVLRVHPFLALIAGAAVLGIVGGLGAQATIDSFEKGVGATVGSVGLLIALGAMIGGLLADSGGADTVVGSTVSRVSGRALPWAMAGVAALIGIPLFFEVGVVLLVPIVLLVARRTDQSLVRIGIPALAGLSVLHGFVPPHPGPLAAIAVLKADLGLTLALGLLVAIPCVILAGPVYGSIVSRYVTVTAADAPLARRYGSGANARAARGERLAAAGSTGAGATTLVHERDTDERWTGADEPTSRPSLAAAVAVVLLPVVLMLARALAELTLPKTDRLRTVLDVVGNPVVALLAGVVLAMLALGAGTGMSRRRISDSLGGALGPIAGILLIVAAGGGFKQTLVDAGVGNVIADWAKGAHISALVLGWLVAVGIRLATGSATVATITAAGIVAPLASTLDKPGLALLVLAIGAGSLFFSHVNDAGFWLVKEYFGMTVGQTIKTWSVMETIISVVGIVVVLLLHLVL